MILPLALLAAALAGTAETPPSPCDALPHPDHPRATLSNGALEAVLFLPDPTSGFYRGARFDWAGVIPCVAFRGHTFFGEWFPRYDPLLNDAITGPVEEFRAPASELGYPEAPIGGPFLKIGVGVLGRIDQSPYRFGAPYPILDQGKRTTHIGKRAVTFTQDLHTAIGFAYRYTKTIKLDRHGAVLTLQHTLKNTGARRIETDVYDHDFFMLDHQPTGPGMAVHLGFAPVPDKPFPPTATIAANDIVFTQPLARNTAPQGYLTGYTGKPGEYRITVENRATHVSVDQTSDSPLSKFYFWSTPQTICPEAYIHIDVAPGKTQRWTIRYTFHTDATIPPPR